MEKCIISIKAGHFHNSYSITPLLTPVKRKEVLYSPTCGAPPFMLSIRGNYTPLPPMALCGLKMLASLWLTLVFLLGLKGHQKQTFSGDVGYFAKRLVNTDCSLTLITEVLILDLLMHFLCIFLTPLWIKTVKWIKYDVPCSIARVSDRGFTSKSHRNELFTDEAIYWVCCWQAAWGSGTKQGMSDCVSFKVPTKYWAITTSLEEIIVT